MIFESSWYFDDGSWEVVIWVPTLQPFKTFYDTMNLAGQRPKKRKEWQPTQLWGSGRGGEKHRHGPGRGWDWEVPFKVSLCFAMFGDCLSNGNKAFKNPEALCFLLTIRSSSDPGCISSGVRPIMAAFEVQLNTNGCWVLTPDFSGIAILSSINRVSGYQKYWELILWFRLKPFVPSWNWWEFQMQHQTL